MPSYYVNPVPEGTTTMRQDQGQDYKGPVGGHVVAMGSAVVDAVKDDPSGFGKAIYYTLLDGPAKGQQIYVGHTQPLVSPGQQLRAGDPVSTLVKAGAVGGNASQDGWTEIGLAKGGQPQFPSPVGGQRFQAILKDATLTAPQQSSPQPPTPTNVTSVSPAPSVDAGLPVGGGPPAPESTLPMVLAPGSGDVANAAVGGYVNNLWQQIASQPNASPDTLAYVQNVALAGG